MNHVEIYNPSNGQSYATASTPRNSDGTINLSDNSSKIATTEWVNSKQYIRTINNHTPDTTGNVNIYSHNIGDEWFTYTGKIPVGGIPYCGQEVSRVAYSDLWSWIQEHNLVKTEDEWNTLNTSQNGNVPFYSDGDGSSTFRMPKVVGYIKGTNDIDGVGVYTAEGLPNITGTAKGDEFPNNITGNGCFYDAGSSYDTATGASSDSSILGFDASLSNSIYGNSDHVTPETVTVLFGVYAYGEVNLQGSTITVDQLASEIVSVEKRYNSRIDSIPHVIETWKSGPSWYRKYSDGWIEQGGSILGINGATTVTFPISFSDTNYNIYKTLNWNDTTSSTIGRAYFGFRSCTTTTAITDCYTTPSGFKEDWYACGY